METSNNMCRCCMNQARDMSPIFCEYEIEKSITLKDLLQLAVPRLKISKDDQLPKHICAICEQEVKNIHKFQQNCVKNEAKLYKILVEDIEANWIKDDIKFEDELAENASSEVKYEIEALAMVDNTDVESIDNCSEFVIDMSSNTDTDSEGDNVSKVEKIRNKKKITKKALVNGVGKRAVQMEDSRVKSDIEQVDKIESCSDYSIDMIWSDDEGNAANDNKTVESVECHKTQRLKKSRKNTEVHSCDKCGKNCTSKANLARHQLMHEPKKLFCEVCQKAFRRTDRLKDHMKLHTNDKRFLCPECGKRFITSHILSQHLIRHSNEKNFSCPHCPKCFRTNADLKGHLISHKINLKSHICEECGREFSRQFLLKQHKMYHSKERNFQCELCEKRFYTNEKLQRHRRIHTGEKPYKCKFCDKAYIQTNELTKHLRIHLGENIYQCELCPQRFPNVKSVKEHFNSHKNDDTDTRNKLLDEHNALEVKGLSWK